jgi:hypothetical protein
MTERDLLSHVLVLGSTGGGKTTLLIQAIWQLLNLHATRPEVKVGLLIFDPKVDETVSQVKFLARKANREKDVIILGPGGDHYLDLFGRLRSLEDVDFVTRRLLAGTQSMGPHNTYWDEARYAMIDAALTLLVVGHPSAARAGISFDAAADFLRSWFFNLRTAPKAVTQTVERARKYLLDAHTTTAAQRQVQSALDQFELWKELDPRTRSNLQSCLINALRPLLSVTAAKCFESVGRSDFKPAQIANEGKIAVISCNALAEPQVAQLLFKLVRQDFFEAVQRRKGSEHRLCGMIADEFPLVAIPEDVEQLATVRAKRCFVLAAAQGLSGLAERLGERVCRTALLNFNTLVFLRTREEETEVLAYVSLRQRQERVIQRRPADTEDGTIALLGFAQLPESSSVARPVCPAGTLGSLEPHQGFVISANGLKTDYPVWFIPWFEDEHFPKPAKAPPKKEPVSKKVLTSASNDYVQDLLARRGRKPLWSPEVVMAVTELCQPQDPTGTLFSEVEVFFRGKACMIPQGLETLPRCWLRAIPKILWSLRRPHWTRLPYMIKSLSCTNGILLVCFAQEQQPRSKRITRWDNIRIALNLSLYPSRWRPLSRRHFAELWLKRPDLRSALQSSQPEVQ